MKKLIFSLLLTLTLAVSTAGGEIDHPPVQSAECDPAVEVCSPPPCNPAAQQCPDSDDPAGVAANSDDSGETLAGAATAILNAMLSIL